MCGLVVLLAAANGALSCKGFTAAPKVDAGGDLVATEAGHGGGGSSAGTGGTTAIMVGSGGRSASGGSGGSRVDAGSGDSPVDGGSDTTGSGGASTGSGGTGAGPGTGGSGGVTCTPAQHLCSGACVDSSSIDSCGTQCDPCKPPAGATATCDGTACDFSCGGGMKKCAAASICVAATGCCASDDCPAQAGGQTGTCDSGTHTCNYGCPANTQACTVGGATSCLPAGGCCQDSDCTGECQTCSATSHTCVAAINKDDPNGRCSGTCDATGACKSKRGQTCATTRGGCLAGSTCSPDGYCCDQTCTGSCLACDLAGKEGTCTPVPSGPPHGSRSACAGAGTTCGGSCGNRADGACVYPTAVCAGPSCAADGARGQSTCSGGSCVAPATTACANGCDPTNSSCLSCGSGQTGCSGVCKNLSNDPQNCGGCSSACQPPSTGYPGTGVHGAATCSGGQCGYTCNSGYMKCPGGDPKCQRNRWDFEDGTTQDFFLRTDIPDLEESAVLNSTTRAHTGTHALALPLKTAGGIIDLNLPACSDQAVWLPTAGRSISAWFYIDGALNSSSSNYLAAGVWGCAPSNGSTYCTISNISNDAVPVNTWFQIVSPAPDSFAGSWPLSEGFTLSGYLYPTGSTAVLYVDDVVFQ